VLGNNFRITSSQRGAEISPPPENGKKGKYTKLTRNNLGKCTKRTYNNLGKYSKSS
jgi:hypothetical protein